MSPHHQRATLADPPGHLPPSFDEAFLHEGFRGLLPLDSGVESHLRGVIEDVLSHPGSLVRARLAYSVASGHGVAPERARELAIAIEYFHSASLVFDDMPSMDDAARRRGRPCPHLRYGEAAATLGALALINRGYALLWRVIGDLPGLGRHQASELVASCLGERGILNGQSQDLHFDPAAGAGEQVLEVAVGKTVSLIRLTLLLPAIVAGCGTQEQRRLERLATVWGLAYQILDDFKDCLMSGAETGKSTRRDATLGRPNLPDALGPAQAMTRVSELIDEGRGLVDLLDGERFPCLEDVQSLLESERRRVRQRLPVAACA